jgi:WD40 repeat protein
MSPHASGPERPVGNPRNAPLKHAVGASYQCREPTVNGRTPRRADIWEPRCGTSTCCSPRGPCGACPSLSRRRECCPVRSRAGGQVDRVTKTDSRTDDAKESRDDRGGPPRVRDRLPVPRRSRRAAGGGRPTSRPVCCSPDGTIVASAGNDGVVRLSSASTGRQVAVLDCDAFTLSGVAFSPDGRWLAATARDDDHLRVWELLGALPSPRPTVGQHRRGVLPSTDASSSRPWKSS